MLEKVSGVLRKIENIHIILRNELPVSHYCDYSYWSNLSVAFLATAHMSHILMC